ncbi:MAG: hypothetical protein EPN45_05790 [Rhizobiaceae bacterium]|nr:MAG: hypothetical protein EPN45_05790 [Rhizobiaceae bacterium]
MAFERQLKPGRQGKPGVSQLDAHETFILAPVDTGERDLTLAEIVEHLAAERGVKASVTTIHMFFAKRGITYKNVWPAPLASGLLQALFGRALTYPA